MKWSIRLLVLFLSFSLLTTVAVFAGGNAKTESDHNDGSDHHERDESLPNISAVQLEVGQKLAVVASTSIVGDVVANVGGDSIELRVLVGIGQDPHSYEPTPSALAAVEKAHVVFVNGFGLEEGLLDSIESTAKGVVVIVSTGLEPLETGHDQHEHGPIDPHVWFDPTNVMLWVENIEQALSEADPSNHEGYHGRAEEYLKRLRTLDESMRKKFAALPEDRKKLVTDHHLLGYFADEYGFEVIGAILPSTSTSAEASTRQMAELVELLHHEGVTTIFIGSTVGRGLEKLAESIAEELGEEVRIVGMLTGSLSTRGTQGDTYLGYMEYNVEQIMSGLEP